MAEKIEQIRGDSFEADVSVKDKAGNVVSIAGATIEWKIARRPTGAPPLFTKAIGDGIAITDASGGRFTLRLTAAETGTLTAGEYFHSLRITFADGRVKTVLRQYFTVIESA